MATSLFSPAPEHSASPSPSRDALFWTFVAIFNLAYVFVAVHTPINVNPGLPHDDTLFLSLGRYLAEGHWLGPYNEFTLMKGPGYPAFLALSSLLGFSITLSTALFHCFAVTFLVAVCLRFMTSLLLSALMFMLLLWHPISLSLFLMRIFRDALYYNQVLLFFAAAIGTLFCAKSRAQRLLYAALAGATLGWAWLTREEGIWLIPAIVLLLGGASMHAWLRHQIRPLLQSVVVAGLLFSATHVVYRAGNWWAYGSFVGVDFKEKNYQAALSAIHSVVSGGRLPSISIAKGGRERVYAISPTFATLKDYFEGSAGLDWSALSCAAIPTACSTHEIGPGHFVWALRNAAQIKGHYRSPAEASAFFAQIADEINGACARGDLECQPPLIAEIPPVSMHDIWQRLPARWLIASDIYLFRHPPLGIGGGTVDLDAISPWLRFLNFPRVVLPSGFSSPVNYRLSGWYYRYGNDWFTPAVKKEDETSVGVQIQRNSSADIEAMTKNPAAKNQRFELKTRCNDECTFEVTASDGITVRKKLADFRKGGIGYDVGTGHIHVDDTRTNVDVLFVTTRGEILSRRIRELNLKYFQYAYLPLQFFGLIVFMATTLRYWRQAPFNVCYLLALTSWVLAFSRMALLVILDDLFDSTAMTNPFYGAPIYFHLVCGTVLSLGACIQLFGGSAERASTNTAAAR